MVVFSMHALDLDRRQLCDSCLAVLLSKKVPSKLQGLQPFSSFFFHQKRSRNPKGKLKKKMHAKTDSEGTSLAPSSPTRSPRRTVYYVQSPSRDSHDGEKTTNNSFHSTPIISPMGSPPHSGNHSSRESSSSRFSESLKHHHGGSRKILPNDPHEKKIKKKKKGFEVIDEEGLLDDEDERDTLPRKCYYLAFVLGFFVLFSFFSLVLWGAGNSQKPRITMKVVKFITYLASDLIDRIRSDSVFFFCL